MVDGVRRRWQRFFLKVKDQDNRCLVRDVQGHCSRATVRDISVGGARLELVAGDELESVPGTPLEVFVPEQDISFDDCQVEKWGRHMVGAKGMVVWSEGRECGCRFYRPLGVSTGRGKG